MEQDRFDDLAKKVFSSSSRRRVVGGAIASVVGAGVAAVTGVSAKNDKGRGKARAQGKKGKGKAKGEFTCTAANANNPGAGGCANPLACCASTPGGVGPNCVDFGLQAGGSLCGDVGTGVGVCRTCPTGTRCSGFPLFRCVCDSTSCANGCCINNIGLPGSPSDTCVANGSGAPVSSANPQFDGSYVCGKGGGQCSVCSVGTLFAGCCTSTGACSGGTSNAACGSSGQECKICENDSSCGTDQACTGGTTTTTTTPAPTTTPGPCGFTGGGNPKVTCGTACCGPKRGCNGAGTKCGKK